MADGNLEGAMTRWAWDQGKRPVYNFRSDGRDFRQSDRCLILATAFYEYTDPPPAKPKIKLKDQHRFSMRGSDFFWIVGIIKQGCFAMLTTEPGPDIELYHDRQIVILPLTPE
jgi:putative SOS response-associated peptidase YedK